MNQTKPDLDLVDAYDYRLPRELIAQHPVEQRTDARMLVVDRRQSTIDHYYVRDLPDLLEPGDGLVLNDTKVIPARLVGTRTITGGKWEGLYLRTTENGIWEVLSKTRGHIKVGETLSLRDRDGREMPVLSVLAKLPHGHIAVRPLDTTLSCSQILHRFGRVPLPPYIREGQMVDNDEWSYQTVYAQNPGSVAAPTAGLHFTSHLLRQLQQKGIGTASVTLHVGLGTFRPVSVQRLSEHTMHEEQAVLPETTAMTLRNCRANHGRIIPVGTTSVRVLESAALATGQPFLAWSGHTNLFIRPPFEFQATDCMLTNFHLPKSTLLALVCALAGYELVMEAYQRAIEQRYRFYSYGDCMFIV